MKAKDYIVDRLILFVLFVAGIKLAWLIYPTPEAIIMTTFISISAIIFCGRLLLFICDLFIGKKTENAFFSVIVRGERLRLHPNYYCVVWKFYSGGDRTIVLLNPEVHPITQSVINTDCPPKDMEITISYWRLSKIMIQWKQAE